MKTIYKRATICLILVIAVLLGLGLLLSDYLIHGNEYVMKPQNQHLFNNGVLKTGGTIVDVNGELLVGMRDGERVFADSSSKRKSMLHILGDQYGYIATGVQNTYSSELVGFDFIFGVSASQESLGNTLTLTLDSDLCEYAYECMDGQKGCVGVYNYKTGELVCDVSTPTFDVLNKPDDLDTSDGGEYDAVYLNKLLFGQYAPGSVFKTVTAVCAIDNIPDVFDRNFTCEGTWEAPDGTEIICNDVHGEVTFEEAFNCSCNIAFAQLSIELGANKLTKTVNELGLLRSIETEHLATARGKFDLSNATAGDIGWAGFGQYTDILNPCGVMVLMGSIANGGIAVKPHFVKSIVKNGIITHTGKTEKLGNTMTALTAQKMQKILRSTVTDFYGEEKFYGLEICAKSGTAEVGSDVEAHSWFAGYSQLEDFPYAFVVVVENGGSGYHNAGTIAGKVMNELYEKLN